MSTVPIVNVYAEVNRDVIVATSAGVESSTQSHMLTCMYVTAAEFASMSEKRSRHQWNADGHVRGRVRRHGRRSEDGHKCEWWVRHTATYVHVYARGST